MTTKRGAEDHAGFFDAADTKAKKKMSRSNITPMTIPPKPLRPFVYASSKITASSKAEAHDLKMSGKARLGLS